MLHSVRLFKSSCCACILIVYCLIGLYYLFVLKAKKNIRSAIVLTTKRITEMYLEEPNHRVPFNLKNCKFIIRNYFPQKINSGYIYSKDRGATNTNRMITALHSNSGKYYLCYFFLF